MEQSPCKLLYFGNEYYSCILEYLTGAEAQRACAAIRPWKFFLQEGWIAWSRFCQAEFGDNAANAAAKHAGVASSQQMYRKLLAAHRLSAVHWCCLGGDHGLGDRVAQPQMFVDPTGNRIFSYGGWTRFGPQVDLHWAPVCTFSDQKLSFQRVSVSGRPARPGGVQSLTQLWGPNPEDQYLTSKPSAALTAFESAARREGRNGKICGLVLAFGGALGGYSNEHNDWSVGSLEEGDDLGAVHINWTWRSFFSASGNAPQPTPRGAHTATFVPGRLCSSQFPDGCVVVFGGHTRHCTQSLNSVDVLGLHDWQWRPNVAVSGVLPAPRHGHSATLVEKDGKGYIVVVGGGIGNILALMGTQEFADVAVLDVANWNWCGTAQLSNEISDRLPIPGRHHSACLGLGGQILVFGGGRRPPNTLAVLNGPNAVNCIIAGCRSIPLKVIPCDAAAGHVPTGRKMHGAVSLLPWCPAYLIFGGWQTAEHFSDAWLCKLDVEDPLKEHLCISLTENQQQLANPLDRRNAPENTLVILSSPRAAKPLALGAPKAKMSLIFFILMLVIFVILYGFNH